MVSQAHQGPGPFRCFWAIERGFDAAIPETVVRGQGRFIGLVACMCFLNQFRIQWRGCTLIQRTTFRWST